MMSFLPCLLSKHFNHPHPYIEITTVISDTCLYCKILNQSIKCPINASLSEVIYLTLPLALLHYFLHHFNHLLLCTSVTQQVSLPYSLVAYAPVMVDMGMSSHQLKVHKSLLANVKANTSHCTGCGLKTLHDEDGKPHPPPRDQCLLHKECYI